MLRSSPTRVLTEFFAIAFLFASASCGPSGEAPDPTSEVVDGGRSARMRAEPDAAPSDGCQLVFSPRHHPLGWDAPTMHGPEAKMQRQDCRLCHGSELQGCGAALSCDSCHSPGWRTNCTYCHGGELNGTGAPPSDLLRDKPAQQASFLAHTAHVEGSIHVGFDCTVCHLKPRDVLSPGHIFDLTLGTAEVSFDGGLSRGGIYEGNGRCDNLYCHGNGRKPGGITHTQAPVKCNSCHGYLDSLDKLSPTHEGHFHPLLPGVRPVESCSNCHVLDIEPRGEDRPAIVGGLAMHVDGQIGLRLPDDPAGDHIETQILADGRRRCNGVCHGLDHNPFGIGGLIDYGVWQRE